MSPVRFIPLFLAALSEIVVGVCPVYAQRGPRGGMGHAGAPHQQGPDRAAPKPHSPKQERAGIGQGLHPGEENLDRLSRMNPEERQKALASLPPGKQQRIERKLERFQKMSPEQQAAVRNQLERFNALSPQQQTDVRQSLKGFQSLPQERRVAVRQEIRRLGTLPPEERDTRINSDEFRNRYSPQEQQMIQHLQEVLPD